MIFNKIKPKRAIILFLIFLIILGATYSIYKYTKGLGLLPFGGKVLTSIPCPCNPLPSVLLTVSPPVGGQFIYLLGTQKYLNFNLGFGTGMWALGLHAPDGGVCLVFSPKGCSPLGLPRGTINGMVGTSLVF